MEHQKEHRKKMVKELHVDGQLLHRVQGRYGDAVHSGGEGLRQQKRDVEWYHRKELLTSIRRAGSLRSSRSWDLRLMTWFSGPTRNRRCRIC